MDNILKAEPLYITGTGTKVLVTNIEYYQGQDDGRLSKSNREDVIASIKFIDPPDKKTIMKCEQFNVNVRETPQVNSVGPQGTQQLQPAGYRVDVNSMIKIENLSTTPYETKAAKILYKKS
jgi:hypothetical protein